MLNAKGTILKKIQSKYFLKISHIEILEWLSVIGNDWCKGDIYLRSHSTRFYIRISISNNALSLNKQGKTR